MEWTEDLSVGVGEIDEQHKELFRRINDLVKAIKQARCKYTIDETIGFLEDYAQSHFTMEEEWMQRTGYGEFGRHMAQHRVFLESLAQLKKQAAEPRVQGASYELSVTTNQVVVDWIVVHIQKIDKRFGEFLKSLQP